MISKLQLSGLVFCLLTSLNMSAKVIIDGEFRPRTEFRHGYKKPLADSLDPAFITFQRTRLQTDYLSKNLNTRVVLQDARIWGDSPLKSSTSKVEILEAWFEYMITPKLAVKMGRQVIQYDDKRIFSAANWSNSGKVHDLMLVKYKPSETLNVHAGFAFNNSSDILSETNYTTSKMYKSMGFQWLSKTFSDGMKVSVLGVEEGLQKTGDYTMIYPRITMGSYFSFMNDTSRFSCVAEGYYQTGKSSSFDDLSACMLTGKVNYQVTKTFEVTTGMDYYSGTKADVKAGTTHTFNKLYGTNHSFNGHMDYWTSVPQSGLTDLYLGCVFKVGHNVSTFLTCHSFSLVHKPVIGSNTIDKNMGSELDLKLNCKVSKEMSLQTGYCMYFYSKSSKAYFQINNVNTRTPQWAYLMLTVRPNFYKTPVAQQ